MLLFFIFDVTFSILTSHSIDMGQEQFKQEILPLRPQLLGYARRMMDCPDEAEDIVQEVFLKLWMMREGLDRYRSVTALSLTITKNLCLTRLHVKKRYVGESTVKTAPQAGTDPHRSLEQRDSLDRTMSIIETLPSLQQAILKMKHVDGLETEEIAALTGGTPESVRVNLSRARKRVRELFLTEER